MIPKGAHGIGHLAARVAQDLIPQCADAYMAADLTYTTLLMTLIAQDYDRAADVLVTDNAQVAALLRQARPLLADSALQQRIAQALEDKPANLRVAELTARSDLLLKLLIEVHAAAEEAQGVEWATALDRDIWRFLEAYALRQAYDVPV